MRSLKRTLVVLGSLLFTLATAAALVFYINPLWVGDLAVRNHLRPQHVLSQYVQVDGYKIHYFEARPAQLSSAPPAEHPLLLIHGLGSHGEDWSGMIPSLAARGFHVYALDLLGYGRSAHPNVDYSIQLQENTVADFMQAVHLNRADVAGWSMGGWIALRLAADRPDLVHRLVLYDSAGVYFPPTYDLSLFTPSDSPGLAHLTSMLSPHPQTWPAFVQRAALRRVRSKAWVINRSLDSMFAGKDLLDFRLDKIEAPVLLVWGKQDTLIPPSVGETMHRNIRGSSLLLMDGCGHLAPAECTRPVLHGTLTFLHAPTPIRNAELTVAGQ